MLVSHILDMKASGKVATISPKASVADAALRLSELRIGSLIVSSDGAGVEGIVSERDIVRELGRQGEACLAAPVSALMTRKVIGCSLEETAVSVLERMTEGRFRHMPVMEGERMIGLISIGDVVKARLSELSMEKNALENMIMGH